MSSKPSGRGVDLRNALGQAMSEHQDELRGTAPAADTETATPAAEHNGGRARATRRNPGRKWDTMSRIEGRLSPKQLRDLTALELRLRDQKAGPGERITKNTLLRVAVEGLLRHQGSLSGSTERELTDSYLATWSSPDADE